MKNFSSYVDYILSSDVGDDRMFAIFVSVDLISQDPQYKEVEEMNNIEKVVDYVLTSEGEDRFFAICLLIECMTKEPGNIELLRTCAKTLIAVASDDDAANVGLIMPELADIMDKLKDDEQLHADFKKLQDDVSLVMLWVSNSSTREAICRILDHDIPNSGLQALISVPFAGAVESLVCG